MNDLFEQIEAQWDLLTAHDNQGTPTHNGLKCDLTKYFAATRLVMEMAHDLVPYYANSLGKEEYDGIEKDEWKIGDDYYLTDSSGILFSARVNVGQYREPEYRERLLSLPWTILEEYIKAPVATQLRLQSIRDENARRVREEKVRAIAEQNEKDAQRLRITEINQLKSLKEKYGNIV